MTIEQATWAALEGVAKTAGVTMSRLAIMAGLDNTAFNKSKREGRSPQVRSIINACAAAGVSFVDFARAVEDHMKESQE